MSEPFLTRDGVTLRFTRHERGRSAVVLVVPGIFIHRESAEHRLLAERLGEVADVVSLDVRGHGDSGGAFTFGLREPDDVAEVAAFLRERYRKVAGLGFSFGGYNIAVAAARHRCFDAVTLVGTPHRLFILDHNFLTRGLLRSLPWMLRRRRRFTRLGVGALRGRPAPSDIVDRIAPAPLLIVHGTDDWLIPAEHARVLYRQAADPKSLLMIQGGLHAENILAADPDSLLVPVAAFLSDTLR